MKLNVRRSLCARVIKYTLLKENRTFRLRTVHENESDDRDECDSARLIYQSALYFCRIFNLRIALKLFKYRPFYQSINQLNRPNI